MQLWLLSGGRSNVIFVKNHFATFFLGELSKDGGHCVSTVIYQPQAKQWRKKHYENSVIHNREQISHVTTANQSESQIYQHRNRKQQKWTEILSNTKQKTQKWSEETNKKYQTEYHHSNAVIRKQKKTSPFH